MITLVSRMLRRIRERSLNFRNAQQLATAYGTHVPRQSTTDDHTREPGPHAGGYWALRAGDYSCSCKPLLHVPHREQRDDM